MTEPNTDWAASLPMYARPELADAHKNYWALIREAAQDYTTTAPLSLSLSPEGYGVEFWRSKHMWLSQTCGLPYRASLHDRVSLVGTPDYELEGCPPGYYCSVIVVREDDPITLADCRSATLAFNGLNSQSGYAAFKYELRDTNNWPQTLVDTGSHSASLKAVVTGAADIASIDAVTWRLAQRYDKQSNGLRVLMRTEPTPGLPYITSLHHDKHLVRTAIDAAVVALSNPDKADLGISKIVTIPKQEYMAVSTPPESKKSFDQSGDILK